jgi:excisionase family DNA binding protein
MAKRTADTIAAEAEPRRTRRRPRHPRDETARPALWGLVEAAHQLSISERQVRRLIDTGQLRALKVGERVVVSDAELHRFVAQLPAWVPRGSQAPQEAHS